MSDYLPILNQPMDDEGPVFKAPWHAQIFAIAVKLNEAGIFTWEEWTHTMGAQIDADPVPDLDGSKYYDYWLASLETVITNNTDISFDDLAIRKEEWDIAAKTTPHGQPIRLSAN